MRWLAKTYGKARTDTDEFTKLVMRHVKKGNSVVDVGCGAGNYFQLLRTLVGKEGEVWAIEPHAGMFAAAKKAAKQFGVKLFRRNVAQLSSLGKQFDVIFASLSLQFCETNWTFRELSRALKPGGLLLFVIPTARDGITEARSAQSRRFMRFFYARMRARMKERGLPPKFDFIHVCGRKKRYARFLSSNGFRILRYKEAVSRKANLEDMLKYYTVPWRSRKIIPGVPFRSRYWVLSSALKDAFAKYPKFKVVRYHLTCAARKRGKVG